VELSIAGAVVLVALYASHCVKLWLRNRATVSRAGRHRASTTPDMIKGLPPGSRVTVRAADGALVQVDLAKASEPLHEV
jgi:hypothetical protein